MTPTQAIAAGLLAGFLHAATGPDHLSAVAPLAAESCRRGWIAGLWWGVGHSGGVWVVATVAFALRGAFPIDLVSAWSERLVGVVLIGVGLWVIARMVRGGLANHGCVYSVDGARQQQHQRHTLAHAPLGIGTLHGLAGTSHIVAVLPALVLPSSVGAIAYLGSFGIGATTAMTMIAAIVGSLAAGPLSGRRAHSVMMLASSAAALALGFYWIIAGASLPRS